MIKILVPFLIAITIYGCSVSDALKIYDLQSKSLQPPEGMSLIYLIKNEGFGLNTDTFKFGDKAIGEYSKGQYLYYFTYPMGLQFIGKNDTILNIDLEAGEITYLLFISELKPKVNVYWVKLKPDEGRRYINKYHLSSARQNVILGNKPIYNKAEKNKKTVPQSQLIYDDNSKKGSVSIIGSIKKRKQLLKQIERICSTKNIAIKVGGNQHQNGASYTTLSEMYTNGKLSIEFMCMY